MSVGELISYLERFNEDKEIIAIHDGDEFEIYHISEDDEYDEEIVYIELEYI